MKHLAFGALGIIVIFGVAMGAKLHTSQHTLLFNEEYIEGLHRQYGMTPDRPSYADAFFTIWSTISGRSDPSAKVPEFNDPVQMFSYVFERLPDHAVIYPTECYYYFRLLLGEQWVSGNLRLVEIDNGQIGMGYFRERTYPSKRFDEQPAEGIVEYGPRLPGERPSSAFRGNRWDNAESAESRHRLFSAVDGLRISRDDERIFSVSFRGKTVRFELPEISLPDSPKPAPLSNEEIVSPVRDESGIDFYLIYNRATKAFYYLLREDTPITDNLTEIQDSILKGTRTGFLFFYDRDHERKVLVGVESKQVFLNSYFDGPFDQVPPRLDIREKVYAAYPYTQFNRIDRHGNFLNSDSTRIAITPYKKYRTPIEVIRMAEECAARTSDADTLWSCLTYESKRDFHKNSPMFTEDGELKKRSSVPESPRNVTGAK